MCEMPTVYACDRPTARKEHKCCECQGAIRVGEKYHKHHGIWDGEAETYKVCEDCEALRERADKAVRYLDEKTAFTQLYETVFECRDAELVVAYVGIRRARAAVIPEWMLKREAEAKVNTGNEPRR